MPSRPAGRLAASVFGPNTATTAGLKEMLELNATAHRRIWSRREGAYNEIREMTSSIDEDIRLIVERPLRSRKAKVVSLGGAS